MLLDSKGASGKDHNNVNGPVLELSEGGIINKGAPRKEHSIVNGPVLRVPEVGIREEGTPRHTSPGHWYRMFAWTTSSVDRRR